jgi:ribosome-associated toxin RatA of RatAB toxin-antitoxin module
MHAYNLPFILDTSATCYISPEASNFKNIRSIPCHPVKGLCGSAVYATGIGDIKLHIAGSHTLKLIDTLYIPESTVCLISILTLNKSSNYTTHFDSDGCWVTNKSNTILICSILSSSKHLYILSTKTPYVQHHKQFKVPITATALYTRVPDIETWHRWLGHCNTQSIINMAKKGVTKGMPIDLSLLPANCHHCTIRKQSHSQISKIQEGVKADKCLGRVYVDICGPMAITSHARNMYALNMINDFSSYVWSVPLCSKADTCITLQTWHKAVTVQSSDIL